MPTGRSLCALLAVPIAMAVSACAPGPDEPVVARVGDTEITADEFRTRAQRMLRYGRRHPDTLGMDAKRELLDDIVAQELVVMEGLRRGLDRDSVIAEEVERLEQRALIETLYTRQAARPHHHFTEEVIEAYYRQNGLDTAVLSEQIVCSSADSARQALAELQAGKTFAEIVPRYTLPRIQRRFGQDGNVGWFLMADMLPALRAPMSTMAVGDLTSEPVRSGLGYHVFRLDGRRDVPLDSVRTLIVKKLDAQRREQDRRQYVSELRQRYQLKAHPDELAALHALPPSSKVWPAQDAPLFTWNGGQYTCRDYMAFHRLGRIRHPSSLDPADLHKLVDNLAGQQVMQTEARRLGYDELEPIRASVERKRDQLLAAELYRLEGRSRAPSVSEAQVDSYLLARHDDPRAPLDLEAISPAVRRRVRSLLGREDAERAMDELLVEIRTRYQDRVRIYDDALAEVALER